MKKIAVAALALVASQVSAQQARLDAFSSDRESAFSVLVPGSVAKPEPVEQPAAADTWGLQAEFDAMASEDPTLEEVPEVCAQE